MPIRREDIEVMDPEGEIDDVALMVGPFQQQMVAKFAAAILDRHYPRWAWSIEMDQKNGIMRLCNGDLANDIGYTLLFDDVWNGGNYDHKLILMAGGEILERYGLPRRGKFPGWMAFCTFAPGGVAVPDMSDKKAGLIRHLFNRLRLKTA